MSHPTTTTLVFPLKDDMVLLLAHLTKVDLTKAFDDKMQKNATKYPVEKVKGHHNNKYNQAS